MTKCLDYRIVDFCLFKCNPISWSAHGLPTVADLVIVVFRLCLQYSHIVQRQVGIAEALAPVKVHRRG